MYERQKLYVKPGYGDLGKGSGQSEEEPPSCDRSTGSPAKKQSETMGRSFDQAPQEICLAISSHPHWGGDYTTTMRWQDAGAVPPLKLTLEHQALYTFERALRLPQISPAFMPWQQETLPVD